MLSLMNQTSPMDRVVADSHDHATWMKARARGVTATDAAKLATEHSIDAVARDKLYGNSFAFAGSAYIEHGKEREPVIAAWVEQEFGIPASSRLFHAENNTRHLATPDGMSLISDLSTDGTPVLVEIKTTSKEWRNIPAHYVRQVQWQQYVLGASSTLFVWEYHENFEPVGGFQWCWIDRDDTEIARLITLADKLLKRLDAA